MQCAEYHTRQIYFVVEMLNMLIILLISCLNIFKNFRLFHSSFTQLHVLQKHLSNLDFVSALFSESRSNICSLFTLDVSRLKSFVPCSRFLHEYLFILLLQYSSYIDNFLKSNTNWTLQLAQHTIKQSCKSKHVLTFDFFLPCLGKS